MSANIDFKNQFQASANTNAQAVARLKTELMSQLNAMAQAQVGYQNKLDSMQQTVKSGRDSVVENIQFTQNMVDTIKSGNETLYKTVLAPCAVILGISECSRRRADKRHKECQDLLHRHLGATPLSETKPGSFMKNTSVACIGFVLMVMCLFGFSGCQKISPQTAGKIVVLANATKTCAADFAKVAPNITPETWAADHLSGLSSDAKGMSDLQIAVGKRP